VRALDRHMPAFGDALPPDDIRLAISHVRTFCADPAWPQGDLNFPRALITEKAFPENESLLTTSFQTGPAHAMSNAILHERRFGSRTMMEFNIPFETQVASMFIFKQIESDNPIGAAAISVVLLVLSLGVLIGIRALGHWGARHDR